MKTITFLSLVVILFSCGLKEDPVHVKVSEKDFQPMINQKNMPENPNLNADRSMMNRDYPIEVALYKDQKWYYDLPNLGTGTGTWKYQNGVIKLHAVRDLFEMQIDIMATKANAEELALQFNDRFGSRFIKIEKNNIQ